MGKSASPKLYIEILDAESGENLIADGSYSITDFTIDGSQTVATEINNELERELLVISDSIWKTGKFDYTLTVDKTREFHFELQLERSGGEGCCSNLLFLKKLDVNGDSKYVEFSRIIALSVETAR